MKGKKIIKEKKKEEKLIRPNITKTNSCHHSHTKIDCSAPILFLFNYLIICFFKREGKKERRERKKEEKERREKRKTSKTSKVVEGEISSTSVTRMASGDI